MIVTEAIYDVRESDNCPRNFETHFTNTKFSRPYTKIFNLGLILSAIVGNVRIALSSLPWIKLEPAHFRRLHSVMITFGRPKREPRITRAILKFAAKSLLSLFLGSGHVLGLHQPAPRDDSPGTMNDSIELTKSFERKRRDARLQDWCYLWPSILGISKNKTLHSEISRVVLLSVFLNGWLKYCAVVHFCGGLGCVAKKVTFRNVPTGRYEFGGR